MNKDLMKNEAVKRMNKLGLYEPTVEQFDKQDIVSMSTPPLGACYWVDDDQKARIKKFEEKYNGLVYHVIRNGIDDMLMDCYLYVSNNEEEWKTDNNDIKDGYVFCYVDNLNYPEFSEFGTIGVKRTIAHGLNRTW